MGLRLAVGVVGSFLFFLFFPSFFLPPPTSFFFFTSRLNESIIFSPCVCVCVHISGCLPTLIYICVCMCVCIYIHIYLSTGVEKTRLANWNAIWCELEMVLNYSCNS